jgi:DNA integrity scanning protein DisA with diadenylate cyclase activity
MLGPLPAIRLVDILDILLVAFIFYWILLFIRGTRAVEILLGLLFLMGVFIISKKIGMVTFPWVIGNFFGGFIVILVVIFQSEIRRGLARMGQTRILGWPPMSRGPDILEELAVSAFRVAESRTGALILLSPLSPVHDGAVVIRGERVAAVQVILPIPAESPATRGMGTRHRAAWGMATDTDAISVVISEETGIVTVFFYRQKKVASDAEELLGILRKLFET